MDASKYWGGVVNVYPKSVDDLPDHIRENASPGRWVHVVGAGRAQHEVDYWGNIDCPADDEDEANGYEALGRRIAEVAYGRF